VGVLSIRELNANISRALARVEAGEVLDISRNGKVIAELRPKAPVRDAAWHKAYADMVARLEKGVPIHIDKVTYEDKYGDAEL
jgi:hypothetical protein